MRRTFSLPKVALTLLLAPIACGTLSDGCCCISGDACETSGTDSEGGSSSTGGTDTDGIPNAEPVERRHIAVVPDGTIECPAADPDEAGNTVWTRGRLFEGGNGVWTDPKVGAMPEFLARYCLYTWTPTDRRPTEAPHVEGALRVDPDPDILVPQAQLTGVDKKRRKSMLAALAAEPANPSVPAGSPYGSESPMPWVAVIDTFDPDATGTPKAAQRHGLAMKALIDTVRCPWQETACLDKQFSVSAFPPWDDVPQGHLGSPGTLAEAVVEAVTTWLIKRQGDEPLVINMSVGWDMTAYQDAMNTVRETRTAPDLVPPGGQPNVGPNGQPNQPSPQSARPLPADLEAAYSALLWASCHGALSIAATGNARGARCDQTGTMGPAALEDFKPSSDACEALGLQVRLHTAGPVVYGVGAVDPAGRPVANTRIGSMSGRAVFGYQAIVDVSPSSAPVAPLPWTGTSVGTAGLAGIAAQAWSYANDNPGGTITPAAQLMSQIETAAAAPSTIDARWLAPEAGGVAIVRAHTALAAIINGKPGVDNPYHPPAFFVPFSPTEQELELVVSGSIQQIPPNFGSKTMVKKTVSGTAACTGMTVSVQGMTSTDAFPPVDALSDDLRPQPGPFICPNCGITRVANSNPAEYRLLVEIADDYQSSTVTLPTLTLFDPASGDLLSFTLDEAIPTDPSTTPAIRIPLGNYVLSDNTTVDQWIASRQDVTSALVSFIVDDPPSSIASQAMTDVIDLAR